MPRKKCLRFVRSGPEVTYYKPAGIPLRFLEEVVIGLDEFEALRLADLEGKYQEEAAQAMNISRQTFGRLIESARRKVAEALIGGKSIRLEGGNVHFGKPKDDE
jgi:uncharacterized protein